MKKALSLVEVMVAILLLTIIITTVLQIQQNNIFFLEKFKNSSLYNSYISLVVETPKSIRNESFILSDKINLDDDDIRKEFKNIKISVKDVKEKDLELPQNDYIKNAIVTKSIYSIEGKTSKSYYTFKLQ
ncbi:MAG: hypothetical protein U9Q20_06535 [Campylobacterota bacterium]|nr:hypothetical protein [Campylobacterota bacterium]